MDLLAAVGDVPCGEAKQILSTRGKENKSGRQCVLKIYQKVLCELEMIY